jgi:GrpB-like predicted nucleotidyltransferase (UPF0157 family)
VNDWPAWATEAVEIRDYDESWGTQGDVERRSLDLLLAPWLVRPVEHVGSTAIPGLAAKPILDFQAGVRDLSAASDVAEALKEHAWHYVPPEIDGDHPWRRFFVKVVDERRFAHLHLMDVASARWAEQLAFRNALRADRSLASRYAQLKTDLAEQHRDDREAYSLAKAAFIQAVVYPTP